MALAGAWLFENERKHFIIEMNSAAKPRGDCREMLRVLCPPSASKMESSGCSALLSDAW